MYIGADYYPEHWPVSRWETDAKLMKKAGFNIVRLAEFAWVNMEPQEGHFDFAWLDDALRILGKHGVSAILSTPTAVMPAWCARKYPETLATQPNGKRITWGVRKNNCFNARSYHMLSERITTAMAEHFAATPNVIGWQTDNEFGGPVCHCETCRKEFQEFLRGRFGTLEQLNKSLGMHFWGHHYRDWDEIPIPDDEGGQSPSLLLEHRRFHSSLNVRFQAQQVRILRQLCPRHFVTHNLMGFVYTTNYYDLAKDLDFVSWDNYPTGIAGVSDVAATSASAAADLMRGLKGKNFWIMEQTAGPLGWGTYGVTPKPGQIRQISYQQLAHGCDGQLWFRWRSCTAGREQYWHGLLGHDGVPRRRYQEAAQVAKEYHQLAPYLEGTTVKASVAFVYDYDCVWAFRAQPCYEVDNKDDWAWEAHPYIQAVRRYYNALFRAGVNVDFVPPTADLSKYKVVFAPHLYVMPDDLAHRLSDYVKQGGVLVMDTRSGVKDEHSLCHDRTLPGLLSKTLGIEIEEYEVLAGQASYPVLGVGAMEGNYTASRAVDYIRSTSADLLAAYNAWNVMEYAAATRNRFGKGWGFYVGAVFGEKEFYDNLVAQVLATAKVKPILTPPAGVEVSVRQGKGKKLLFVINHTEKPVVVTVPEGKRELITGTTTSTDLKLGRYGVAVLAI